MKSMKLACGILAGMTLVACSSGGNAQNFGKGTPVSTQGFKFQPETLSVVAGKEMQIDLTNTGSIEHNFTIDEAGVAQDVSGGGKATFKVKIDKPGQYAYFCRFHATGGMTGVITVTEKK